MNDSPNEETIYKLLARIGMDLEVPVSRGSVLESDQSEDQADDPLGGFTASPQSSDHLI